MKNQEQVTTPTTAVGSHHGSRARTLELRVLVDGVDMAGKSTLVRALVAELEARGVPAARLWGMLAGLHPLQPLLRQLSSARQPDTWWMTTAYVVGGFLLDGLLVRFLPPRPRGRVIVQDSYGDRTVAFGMAGGPYLAAVLALRWPRAFARFGLAVFLHASHAAPMCEFRSERNPLLPPQGGFPLRELLTIVGERSSWSPHPARVKPNGARQRPQRTSVLGGPQPLPRRPHPKFTFRVTAKDAP